MRLSRGLLINAVGVVVLVAALVVVGRLGPGNQGAQHSSRPTSRSTQRPVGLPDHSATTLPSPVVAKIGVADRPVDAVAASPGAVWAASGCTVLGVDPTVNLVVARVAGTGRANRCVRGLAVGAGAVWGAVPGIGVVRIDPQGNRVVAMVPVGPIGESIAVGAGGVWLVCCGKPVPDGGRTGLVRVDPAANRSSRGSACRVVPTRSGWGRAGCGCGVPTGRSGRSTRPATGWWPGSGCEAAWGRPGAAS